MMNDHQNHAHALKRLQTRLRKLAFEKSALELTMRMMMRLTAANGLEDAIDSGLRSITEVIGATNTILFYQHGDSFCTRDVFKNVTATPGINDPDIRACLANKMPVVLDAPYEHTKMTFPIPEGHAYTWLYPLVAGTETVGAIKVENTAYSTKGAEASLSLFFAYFAQVLKNELHNTDQLLAANRKLEQLNRQLELRVKQRTRLLQQPNQKLLRSESNYRMLVENQAELVAKIDLRGTCEFVSPSYCRLFGTSEEDLLGRDLLTCGDGWDGASLRSALDALRSPPHEVYLEHHARTSSGNRWIGWIFSTLPAACDNPESILCVGRDITENKRLEDKLLHAGKMETIASMSGGIAHDFNNLLFMIIANAELALDDIAATHPAYQSILEIKRASLQGADIVKQLMSYTREADTERKLLSIRETLRNSAKLLRASLPSNIDLQLRLPTHDIFIQGNAAQINQVLANLCLNAAEALRDANGTIAISAESKPITHDRVDLSSGSYLHILVADTGPGIDPAIKEKIFDPYFSTKKVGKGSGMGLTVAAGIVKNHGGAITVESAPGTGAHVSLFLPVSEPPPEPTPQKLLGKTGSGGKILFIDDEKYITRVVHRMLQRVGYHVETQSTPHDALATFTAGPEKFDLVITDMTMPQMSGVELSRRLLQVRPDIPIILCSGYNVSLDNESIGENGIRAQIMKPIDKETLINTIGNVLRQAQP